MLYALPSLWKPGFERADSATEEVEWFSAHIKTIKVSDTHSGTAEDKGSTLLCLSVMTCLIFENVL